MFNFQTKLNSTLYLQLNFFIIECIQRDDRYFKLKLKYTLFIFLNKRTEQYPMLSTLKLTTVTYIGREQQKKLTLIISYLIDLPEAAQFIHPVDWQDLQLNDYPLVIKNPMNLLKVQDRMKAREYRTVQEVLDHIQLIWDNCKVYNSQGPFYILADKMQRAFKKMIKNYLPNIQVIVPKPINSRATVDTLATAANNPTNPPTQQNNTAKAPAKPATKTVTPVSQPNLPPIQEPASVNQPVENLPEPEEIPLLQKNRLHQRLRQLSQQQLGQIVLMVQEHCPEGFKQSQEGKCQLLLDNIDLQTFKRINQRIDDLLQGEKGAISGNKKIKL